MSRMPCCWPAGWSSTIEHTVIENRVAVTNGNRFREYLVPDLGALNADGLCGRVDGSSLIKRLLCTDSLSCRVGCSLTTAKSFKGSYTVGPVSLPDHSRILLPALDNPAVGLHQVHLDKVYSSMLARPLARTSLATYRPAQSCYTGWKVCPSTSILPPFADRDSVHHHASRPRSLPTPDHHPTPQTSHAEHHLQTTLRLPSHPPAPTRPHSILNIQ